jgi:ribosome-associated heat shock protein Hsp15
LLYEDLTPPSDKRVEPAAAIAERDKGTGRPTKRDRRDIEDFTRKRDD